MVAWCHSGAIYIHTPRHRARKQPKVNRNRPREDIELLPKWIRAELQTPHAVCREVTDDEVWQPQYGSSKAVCKHLRNVNSCTLLFPAAIDRVLADCTNRNCVVCPQRDKGTPIFLMGDAVTNNSFIPIRRCYASLCK